MTTARVPAVVVTGAAGGIGRAIVASLGQAGWLVVAVDRDPAVQELAAAGAAPIVGDVADPQTHARAVEAAGEANLRGWVNNAAIQIPQRADEISASAIQRQLEVNVVGTMWGCSAAVRAMTGGGSVVSISSIHAERGFPSAFVYAATKGAIVSLARQLAVDFGPRGIRSNAVLPGAIHTAMCTDDWRQAADPAAAQAADEGLHLMNRMGTPDEIAHVVEFLLSDRSSLINGQTIVADGGATARPPFP